MHKHFEIFKIRTGLVLTIQKRQTYGTNNQEIKKVRSIELSKPNPEKTKWYGVLRPCQLMKRLAGSVIWVVMKGGRIIIILPQFIIFMKKNLKKIK